jgi:hypothetical protein
MGRTGRLERRDGSDEMGFGERFGRKEWFLEKNVVSGGMRSHSHASLSW